MQELQELSQEQEEQLKQLGIGPEDTSSRNRAVEVFKKYPDQGFETLRKWSKRSIVFNGPAYGFLINHGPQKVNEIVDRYGRESSQHLEDIVECIDEFGKETIDEIADQFGVDRLKLIALHYHKYGPELTKKILDEYEPLHLRFAFRFYPEIKEVEKTMDTDEIKQFKIRFTGAVQGVYFRVSSMEFAEVLGIKGWVNNKSDSVLCMVQGTSQAINLFVKGLEQMYEISKVEKKESTLWYHRKRYAIKWGGGLGFF